MSHLTTGNPELATHRRLQPEPENFLGYDPSRRCEGPKRELFSTRTFLVLMMMIVLVIAAAFALRH